MASFSERAIRGAAVAVLMLLLPACGLMGAAQPGEEQRFCDGITSVVGGCDEDRPTFSGTKCEDVGREAGVHLETRISMIVDGPEDPEESKATRVRHFMSLVVSLANNHLRAQGLIRDCDADDFLAVAEQEFSDDFRSVVGEYAWDGPPYATYDQWLELLRENLRIIDMEEDA